MDRFWSAFSEARRKKKRRNSRKTHWPGCGAVIFNLFPCQLISLSHRKRDFDARFKKRGKRPPPDSSSSATSENPPAKKPKSDKPMTEYEKEVKNYAGRNLKDDGIGIRALVK